MANVLTPKFMVSYPNVFKAKKNDLNGKEEFSVVALFPKTADLSKLKAAAHAAAVGKWGSDQTKWPKNIRSPFRDQGERVKTDEATGKEVLPAGYEKGAIFINLKSAQKPGVVDQNVQDIIDQSQFYAGCWAQATVSCYAYHPKGMNPGIAFGLGNIQKVADGTPIGSGRTRAQDDFAPIEGASDNGGDASSLFG
jgi:hypothetical protein